MWTSEDNKLMRQLIKEGKKPYEIRAIMGYDKLRENPKKKFVSNFNKFILEMIMAPKETIFSLQQEYSKVYPKRINYNSLFKTTSGQEYVVDFIYIQETTGPYKDQTIFNLSFSTKEQRDLSTQLTGDISYKKYEEETNKNELIELTKRLLFVIQESIKFIKINNPNMVLMIGETENIQKINFYRNIIKDSLPNITEVEGTSSFTNGLKAYYYNF